jgi:hypothetical protein
VALHCTLWPRRIDVVAYVRAHSYVQFVEEETKRDWHWDARHRPELEMWAKVPNALLCEWSALPRRHT